MKNRDFWDLWIFCKVTNEPISTKKKKKNKKWASMNKDTQTLQNNSFRTFRVTLLTNKQIKNIVGGANKKLTDAKILVLHTSEQK